MHGRRRGESAERFDLEALTRHGFEMSTVHGFRAAPRTGEMMSRIYFNKSTLCTTVAAVSLLAIGAMPAMAQAQSFEEALGLAYSTNPTLDGARANLRRIDEAVPQARGGYLPTVRGQIYGSLSRSDLNPGGADTQTPRGGSITLTESVYRGGRTVAEIGRAEESVNAERGSLFDTEQQVLLSASTAYFDVVRDQAVVELNRNNEEVLARQLEATNDRFRVGEVTKTDVSQAESRHAAAIANRIAAEGNLEITRSAFARVVGQMPEKLSKPELKYELPATLDDAIAMAVDNNPSVVAARANEKAAQHGIDAEFADLLPQVSLQASAADNRDPSIFTNSSKSLELTASVTIPFYQAGVATSQVRQAKQSAARARRAVDEAVRQVTDQTVQAWESLNSARAEIKSRRTAVDSAEVALEGVRQEALVGSRTTLDVLDAEQELLNAQVNLLSAVRNENVANFRVLAAVGHLSAKWLGLPVDIYDETRNYERVNDKFWGVGIE